MSEILILAQDSEAYGLSKYWWQVHHRFHAYILLILRLFDVLITNMMAICGANEKKIYCTSLANLT